MHKFFLQTGAVLGMMGVAIGAFGAHGLRAKLEAAGRFDTFETAVRYHFYHTFALLAVGVLLHQLASNPNAVKWLSYSGYCFLIGVLIFSGSLYMLCLSGVTWLGAITPIGGLFMIAGWALLWWALR